MARYALQVAISAHCTSSSLPSKDGYRLLMTLTQKCTSKTMHMLVVKSLFMINRVWAPIVSFYFPVAKFKFNE